MCKHSIFALLFAPKAALIGVLAILLLAACSSAPKAPAPPPASSVPPPVSSVPPPAIAAPLPPPIPAPLVESARNLELTVQADAQLNTDSRNRSAPLVIRIYSLKSPGAFQSTDFFTLFERDQAILGADLIAREEIQLRPGESRRIVRELPSGARILGVIGAYRELEKSSWRASYLLPEPAKVTAQASAKAVAVPVRISLGAREVRVTAQ